MTKIVVVDKNDRIIGAMDREEVTKRGLIRRIVRILLFDNKGRVFLQKRADRKNIFPNTWDQSAAGHVEKGETYLDAAKRELKEELGVIGLNLIEVIKFYCEENYKNIHIKEHNVLYKAKYLGDKMNINKDEAKEGRWFHPKEIDKKVNESPDSFSQGFLITWDKYREKNG